MDVAMLDWIEMDVIEVIVKIGLVADDMFPEARLPERFPVFGA